MINRKILLLLIALAPFYFLQGQHIMNSLGLIEISWIKVSEKTIIKGNPAESPLIPRKARPELFQSIQNILYKIPAQGNMFKDFPPTVEVLSLEIMDGYRNKRTLYFYNQLLRAPQHDEGIFYGYTPLQQELYKLVKPLLHNQMEPLTQKPISKKGLILHLPLNGNTKDHSGHHNSGVALGATPTTDRFGNPNGAYLFERMYDRIEIPDKPELRLGQTDFTISLWMMEYAYNTHNNAALIVKRGLGSDKGWFVGSLGKRKHLHGNLQYAVSGGGDPAVFTRHDHLPLNTWHHIVLSYQVDKQSLSIYIDGECIDTQANLPPPNAKVDAMLYIGFDLPTRKYGMNGKIDEVMIFRRALDPKEVGTLFHGIID